MKTSLVKTVLPAALLLACSGPLRGGTAFSGLYNYAPQHRQATMVACAAPAKVSAQAPTLNASQIGERFEEDHPSVRYPIALRGDPARYVETGLSEYLRRAVTSVGKAPVPVFVDVATLDLIEKTFHNAEFKGSAVLEVSVMKPDGTPCWSGQVQGQGENYGRAGSEENYRETLNRAVDSAALQLVNNADFQDAMCGKCNAAHNG